MRNYAWSVILEQHQTWFLSVPAGILQKQESVDNGGLDPLNACIQSCKEITEMCCQWEGRVRRFEGHTGDRIEIIPRGIKMGSHLAHCSQIAWGPKIFFTGTQFRAKWGPNGDPQQQKWGPKQRIFEKLTEMR